MKLTNTQVEAILSEVVEQLQKVHQKDFANQERSMRLEIAQSPLFKRAEIALQKIENKFGKPKSSYDEASHHIKGLLNSAVNRSLEKRGFKDEFPYSLREKIKREIIFSSINSSDTAENFIKLLVKKYTQVICNPQGS